MTHIFADFRGAILALIDRLAADGRLPAGLDGARITAEPPRDPAHGDISTNAAMVLAKPAAMKPRDLAALLAEGLQDHPDVTAVEVAGPGFINLRLGHDAWQRRLADLLARADRYGDSDIGGGRAVNVEYVSANPTGPMHVGHARGAVVGDALANLLARAGFDVTREYYINDAGAQVDVLARSAHLRYLEALGAPIGTIPEGLYPGEYLKEVGRALAEREGERWRNAPESEWLPVVREFAVAAMMDRIREDLAAMGVRHDLFVSERELVEAGRVEAVLADLDARGLLYTGILEPPKGKMPDDWEARPQTLFRATDFGDDVDRALRKSDGSYTYFANDIAYHQDKIRRGFTDLIDVWGADHGGYVKRMAAAVKAVSGGAAALDVKLCQLIRLLENGQPAKMSKRAGTFVTLRDLVDEVGVGVVRFIMLTRRNDAALDFDLAKVREETRDNPVFYVQYAHARVCSVLRNGVEMFPEALGPLESAIENGALEAVAAALADTDLSGLTDPDELALIRILAGWPRLVESAAEAHEPHRVAFYLYDLAAAFHALWNRGRDDATLRFLIEGDWPGTAARLALILGVATVIRRGLDILGVVPKRELR